MTSQAAMDIIRQYKPEQLAMLKDAADKLIAERSLYHFVKQMWHVVEPSRAFVEGWAIEAICEHLQAITEGQIRRLIINVPPGFSKSLTTSVFWPAWEWGPRKMPSMRFIAASYSSDLTVRDNIRCRNVIMSPEYQAKWGSVFGISEDQFTKIRFANNKTGWKLATSVGGLGTGERADRFLQDDPNNMKDSESETVLASTNQWALEVVPTRLNDPEYSAILVIQQRANEEDVTGTYLTRDLGYEHLCIPMHFDSARKCYTSVGWEDPREEEGELAWPERFPEHVVEELEKALGPYGSAGQLEQSPAPRGGGIIKREFWQLWEGPRDAMGREQFPMLEYVAGYLDTAFTEKQENDYCAMSVWGLWLSNGIPKLILLNAWKKHLTLHGPMFDEAEYPGWASMSKMERDTIMRKHWGVCEWANHTAKRFNCDTLLIENKANGIDVANEFRRLYRDATFGIQLDDPGRRDKVARAHAVVPMFADKMIYAPDRDWAETCISDCASFPKIAHDDLVDTVTGALLYFRRTNLASLRSERLQEEEALKKYRPKSKPLYPV